MKRRTLHRILAISAVSVAVLFAARMASAQCDGPKRPPTAAEAQAYADGFALFKRIAPPTPAGWSAEDSRTDPVITFICDSPLYDFTRWTFTRTFNRSQAEMLARGDAALKKTEAVRAQADARAKTKEARLADLDRRTAELATRIESAAGQQNLTALTTLSEENNRLVAEREALVTDTEAESAVTAVGAEMTRDQSAQFTVTYGATDIAVARSSAFKPMASAVGKAYRQDGQDENSNPHADLVVVLPPVSGVRGQTVVQISGDPERAEALLSGALLR